MTDQCSLQTYFDNLPDSRLPHWSRGLRMSSPDNIFTQRSDWSLEIAQDLHDRKLLTDHELFCISDVIDELASHRLQWTDAAMYALFSAVLRCQARRTMASDALSSAELTEVYDIISSVNNIVYKFDRLPAKADGA